MDGTRAHIDRTLSVLAITVGLWGLAACSGGSFSASAPATPAAPTKAAAKAAAADRATDGSIAGVNRSMSPAVPMDASKAPVDARFDLASVPVVGAPFEVAVAVLPTAASPSLRVTVTGSDGLVIIDPVAPVLIEKVQAGSVVRVVVKASSVEAGSRVVMVKVTLDLPAGPEQRGFAFPVIVGGGAGGTPPAAPAAPR